MARQYFDDGTFADYDASGSVVRYSDTSGAVMEPDRSIVTEFANVLLGRLKTELSAAGSISQPATAVPASQQINLQKYMPVILLAVGGWALFKFAK